VKDSQEAARDEVWAGYRFAIVADRQEADGLKVIDLGAGHSSSGETLCGRVISALKSEALLNESVGVGYIERNWPPAFKQSGAWPLAGLRQSFLDGSLTRLVDPDTVLRRKIAEFVSHGDVGLASGRKNDGTYERWWFRDLVGTEEITFEPGVFLLTKSVAEALAAGAPPEPEPGPSPFPSPEPTPTPAPGPTPEPSPGPGETRTLRVEGTVPAEAWNRFGTRVLPKLRAGTDLKVGVDFSVTVSAASVDNFTQDLQQIIQELGLDDSIEIN
jgi:hypothetical protein